MPTSREMFRRRALEHYQQGLPTIIHPRFFSSRILALCWVVFFLLIGFVLAAWSWNVPQNAQGVGMLQDGVAHTFTTDKSDISKREDQTIVIIFFPAQFSREIQTRTPVYMRIEGVTQSVVGNIESFDPTVLMPEEVQNRYHPSMQVISAIAHPSVVTFIGLSPGTMLSVSNGSRVDAYIHVGTLNMLNLFLGTQTLPGGTS